MAQLPRQTQPGVAPQGGGQYLSIRIDPNAFGAASGAALTGLGGTLMQTAQVVQQIAARRDDAQFMDTLSQARDEARNFLYNPESGVYSRQGSAALGAQQDVERFYQETGERYAAQLQSPQARQAFSRAWQNDRQNTLDRSAQYELGQLESYRTSSADALINTSVENAYAGYADATIVAESLNSVQTAAATQGLAHGWSDEQTNLYALDGTSRVHTAVISRMMEEDPYAAETYFQTNASQINAEDTVNIQKALRPIIYARNVDGHVDVAMGPGEVAAALPMIPLTDEGAAAASMRLGTPVRATTDFQDMAFLQGHAKNSSIDFSGMNPTFTSSAARAFRIAEEHTGVPVVIVDAMRPAERQAQYRANFLREDVTYNGVTYHPSAEPGGRAAAPGSSLHQTGTAMDLRENESLRWLRANIQRFPELEFLDDSLDDPGHIQFTGPRGSAGAVGTANRYRAAIAGIESGGEREPYRTVGPVDPETGDRPYGKYQIMGANIGPWTQQVLGRRMTAEQFLNDSAAQDAVFDEIFGGYVQKYGPEGAARTWFTGSPTGGGSDVLGTDADSYVAQFSANLAGGRGGSSADRPGEPTQQEIGIEPEAGQTLSMRAGMDLRASQTSFQQYLTGMANDIEPSIVASIAGMEVASQWLRDGRTGLPQPVAQAVAETLYALQQNEGLPLTVREVKTANGNTVPAYYAPTNPSSAAASLAYAASLGGQLGEDVRARVNQRLEDQERVVGLQRDQDEQAAWAHIAGGGSLRTMPPGLLSRLDPAYVNTLSSAEGNLRESGSAGPVVTDPVVYYKLRGLTREAFADVNLLHYRNALSESDFQRLTDIQSDLNAEIAEGAARTAPTAQYFTENRMLENAYNQYHIGTDDARRGVLAQLWQEEMVNREARESVPGQPRKVLSSQEMQETLNMVMLRSDERNIDLRVIDPRTGDTSTLEAFQPAQNYADFNSRQIPSIVVLDDAGNELVVRPDVNIARVWRNMNGEAPDQGALVDIYNKAQQVAINGGFGGFLHGTDASSLAFDEFFREEIALVEDGVKREPTPRQLDYWYGQWMLNFLDMADANAAQAFRESKYMMRFDSVAPGDIGIEPTPAELAAEAAAMVDPRSRQLPGTPEGLPAGAGRERIREVPGAPTGEVVLTPDQGAVPGGAQGAAAEIEEPTDTGPGMPAKPGEAPPLPGVYPPSRPLPADGMRRPSWPFPGRPMTQQQRDAGFDPASLLVGITPPGQAMPIPAAAPPLAEEEVVAPEEVAPTVPEAAAEEEAVPTAPPNAVGVIEGGAAEAAPAAPQAAAPGVAATPTGERGAQWEAVQGAIRGETAPNFVNRDNRVSREKTQAARDYLAAHPVETIEDVTPEAFAALMIVENKAAWQMADDLALKFGTTNMGIYARVGL